MSETVGRKFYAGDITPERKRLVLGFDAGCFTCSDLAVRIGRRVGSSLTVRDLKDPEVLRWRAQALGENSPWTPTLFEVKGKKVRAWTGFKMGWALSRALGPGATWQVMQALGEVGAAPEAVVAPDEMGGSVSPVGFSRGQFLKGMGGAAVAMSVFSGGVLFPSSLASASEVTEGTEEQRRLAMSIARNSSPHQSFATLQSYIGSSFDFANSTIHVYDNRRASVTVKAPATNNDRAVLNSYHVNLNYGTLINYHSLVFAPVRDKPQFKLTYWHNGHIPDLNHQTIFGENYVVTYDNRIMSPDQFKAEAEAHNQKYQTTLQATSTDPYEVCVLKEASRCNEVSGDVCLALGLGATAYGFLVAGPAGTAMGLGFTAGCYIVQKFGCSGAAKDICRDKLAPTIVSKPPLYYC